MNIAHYEEYSNIYGPGTRFTIWMQGCSIHCKGCWNQEMWSFLPKKLLTVEELNQKIFNIKDNIEGITILGGEPFDQYQELLQLIKIVYQENLSIMLYSGYELQELETQQKTEILKYTDILVSGRYIVEQRDLNLQWRGSSNQTINFLSNRYTKEIIKENNYVEISIDEWGQWNIYGFPDAKTIKGLLKEK